MMLNMMNLSDLCYVDVQEIQGSGSAADRIPGTRVRLSLEQKVQLIEDSLQPGFNVLQASQKYGIAKSTVNGILKNKFALYCHPVSSNRKNITQGKNDALEEKLYEWYLQRQNEGLPISGPLLKARAEELANSYDCCASDGFKFSSGWLDGFKKRFDIRFKEVKKS